MARRTRRLPFRNDEPIRAGDTVQVASGMSLLGATGVAQNGGHGKINIDLSDWGYTKPMAVESSRLRVVKRAPRKGEQLKIEPESNQPIGRNYSSNPTYAERRYQERRQLSQVAAEARAKQEAEDLKLATLRLAEAGRKKQEQQTYAYLQAWATVKRIKEEYPTPESMAETDQDIAHHTEFAGKADKRKRSAYWREW